MYSSMNVHRESKHISMFGIPWSTGDSGTWSCFKRQEIEIICSAPTLDAEVTLLQEETKLTYEKYKDRSGDFPYRQTVVLALAQWQRSSAGAAPLTLVCSGRRLAAPPTKRRQLSTAIGRESAAVGGLGCELTWNMAHMVISLGCENYTRGCYDQ